MQQLSIPPDADFVVDWQLDDDASVVIDLSTAESEVQIPDEAEVGRGLGPV